MALTVLTIVWALSLQLLVLTAAAWSASYALGHRAPWLRQLLWRAVAGLAVASPLLSAFPGRPGPQTASAVWHIERAAALVGFSQGGDATATWWPTFALAILIVAALARLAWLLVGAISLMKLRRLPARTSPVFDRLRTELSVDARLVVADVSQPFTFGLRLPTVVMPDDFFARAVEVQRSVFTHELLHVRRRDWGPACIEHVFAALLWFHPAAWFLVRELRQAREEIVDGEAARHVGSRRLYLETLLAFAEPRPPAAGTALAFFRSRQLVRRITALALEAPMSARMVAGFLAGSVAILAAASVAARAWFPINLQLAASSTQAGANGEALSQPSALEQRAFTLPKDGTPPRRVADAPFPYPEDVKARIPEALVVVRIVINADGSVAEARLLSRTAVKVKDLHAPGSTVDVAAEQKRALARLSDIALETVRKWRFEAPAKAPLAMTITVRFDADSSDAHATTVPSPRPVAPAAPAATAASTPRSRPGPGTATDGSAIDDLPQPLHDPPPAYPATAKEQGQQGSVIVRIHVGADGLVKEAVVTKSIPALDQAALDAARQWTFRPGKKNGQPVEVLTDLEMKFTLRP